jgi:cytochrome b pre-mRNA-processing protein 3
VSLGRLFRRRPQDGTADALYRQIVEQARAPAFYRELGVPDSFDGRFEMLALHLFVVLNRLLTQRDDPACRSLAQALTDRLVADVDATLREMGAGDLGVGRKVRRIAEGFNGRLAAYDAGLADGSGMLAQAIRRNVYGTTEPSAPQVAAMTDYVLACRQTLAAVAATDLAQGAVRFAPLPIRERAEGSRSR